MSITSGKVITLTGLAALALVACSSEGSSLGDYATATGGGGDVGGAGGAGGQGGSAEVQEVEVLECYDFTADWNILGTVEGPEAVSPNFDYAYIPDELTIKVGDTIKFKTITSTQNITSGANGVWDKKFFTTQGRTRCLRFNFAGTYPIFSIDSATSSDHMEGVIYVQ